MAFVLIRRIHSHSRVVDLKNMQQSQNARAVVQWPPALSLAPRLAAQRSGFHGGFCQNGNTVLSEQDGGGVVFQTCNTCMNTYICLCVYMYKVVCMYIHIYTHAFTSLTVVYIICNIYSICSIYVTDLKRMLLRLLTCLLMNRQYSSSRITAGG